MDNKILVTQSTMPVFEDYVVEIKDIWETKHLTNFGPKYQKLIGMLKDKFGYTYLDIQSNGHLILQNMLSCLEKKGEIITTPFTFISTTLAISNSGNTPVFCDIDETSFNIDVNKIEDLINDNTVAIVPVHVFGNPCDVEKLEVISKKYNIPVIYDAAHAFGVKINNKDIASYGYASMFSFHATKVFNSVEGGLGVYQDEKFCADVKQMSNFGLNASGSSEMFGINSKFNEFQACMGIANLKNLDISIEKRKKITERYSELLLSIKGIKTFKRFDNVSYNYAYYPVVFDSDIVNVIDVINNLNENNIYPRRYFYPLISDMEIYNNIHNSSDTPIAKKISDNIICLPIYDELSLEDVEKISNLIKNVVEKNG